MAIGAALLSDRKVNESLILRLKTYATKLGLFRQAIWMGSLAMDAGGWGTRLCWTRRSTDIGRVQAALARGAHERCEPLSSGHSEQSV